MKIHTLSSCFSCLDLLLSCSPLCWLDQPRPDWLHPCLKEHYVRNAFRVIMNWPWYVNRQYVNFKYWHHWQQQRIMLIFTFRLGLLLQPPLTSWSQSQCFSSQVGSCWIRQPNSQPLLLRGERYHVPQYFDCDYSISFSQLNCPRPLFLYALCSVLVFASLSCSSCHVFETFPLPTWLWYCFCFACFSGETFVSILELCIWGTSCPSPVSLGRPLFIFCYCSTENEHVMAWILHVLTQPELHLPSDCLWAKGWNSSHSKSFIQLHWWWC